MERFLEIRKGLQRQDSVLLVPTKQYSTEFSNNFKKAPKADWYRSLFVYYPDVISFVDENKKLKGFSGDADAGYICFDLDNKDLEVARQDTIEVLKRLCKKVDLESKDLYNYMDIYFSGNKGFHVFLHTEQRFSPDQMRALCTEIAGDLQSFDTSIYNTTRIIRIENTLHQKSGKYKIALAVKDVVNMKAEEIVAMAENKSELVHKPQKLNFEWTIPEVKSSFQSVVVEIDDDDIRGLNLIDFSKCPRSMPRCVYALAQGIMVPGQGERHHIFRALARFYRNQGMTADQVHNQLKATARMNNKLYPEADKYPANRIWNECVSDLFEGKDKHFNKGGWGIEPNKDEVFKKYCKAIEKYTTKPCCMHNNERLKKFYSAKDMVKGYRKFAKDFRRSIVKSGISFIDQELEIRRRTVTLVVGSAGSGKTTFALKVLENTNKEDIHSVFFCMDMDMFSIYEKLAEKHTKYSRKEIRQAIEKLENGRKLSSKEQSIIDETEATVEEHYSKTIFDFSSTLTMDQMKERIIELEESTGNKIGMVLVDYAGRISSDYKDSYANDKHNALKSKEVAQATDAAWVFLCQTSRNSGDSYIPLRTKRAAKGAGDWEEAAQNVLTVWRPFAGMDGVTTDEDAKFTDDVMRVYLAKNRMGKERELVLHWNPQEGILEEVSAEDLAHYRDQIEPLEKVAMRYRQGKKFGDRN